MSRAARLGAFIVVTLAILVVGDLSSEANSISSAPPTN